MALTVVFDLDGTLVDTAPDLINALNIVFAREQLPPVGYEQARAMIGGGARRMIESGLRHTGRAIAPAEIDRMFGNFIEHYSAHIADRSRPFPGLGAALDLLARDGCRFAVCTNKLEGLSRLLLDTLGLAARFAAVCGQDTFGVQKPDPDILIRTVAAAGGSADRAVMVGDSGTDIATARGAGIPVVAVDFGYTDRPVAEFGPDRVISHFDELPAAVHALAPVRT
jgi:phosphoglycolate phosphatase